MTSCSEGTPPAMTGCGPLWELEENAAMGPLRRHLLALLPPIRHLHLDVSGPHGRRFLTNARWDLAADESGVNCLRGLPALHKLRDLLLHWHRLVNREHLHQLTKHRRKRKYGFVRACAFLKTGLEPNGLSQNGYGFHRLHSNTVRS